MVLDWLAKYLVRIIVFLSRYADIRTIFACNPQRIGHLVLDLGCYIKERRLKGLTRKPLYILDERPIANREVLDLYKEYYTVIDGDWARRLSPLMQHEPMVDNLEKYSAVMSGVAPCYEIERGWGSRPPLFSTAALDNARGRQILSAMGVPEHAWFVCVHARGGGYSPDDEHWHRHRNVDLGSYLMAVEEIRARGGWSIRMGDLSMPPAPPVEGLVDYALSGCKSDWMDVFLCANCRFFLGSCSGLSLLASAFGVPSALTNASPLGCVYSPYRADISIPKLVKDAGSRVLSFKEILSSEVGNFRLAEAFEINKMMVVDNSAEDVKDLAVEMLDRIAGSHVSSPESAMRQDSFRSLFSERHYSYGAISNIGEAFLAKHASLIQ